LSQRPTTADDRSHECTQWEIWKKEIKSHNLTETWYDNEFKLLLFN